MLPDGFPRSSGLPLFRTSEIGLSSPRLRVIAGAVVKKVLILSAGFGEGHNSAARSLKAGLEQAAPGGVDARVLDLFETCYGRANEFAKKAYLATINNAPLVWAKFYDLLDSTKILELNLPTMWKLRKALAVLFASEKPDAVVSTYPVYNFLIEQIYAGPRPFAQVTIVTDSITVNSVWFRPPSDFFFVPNDDTADVLRRAGVAQEKIRALGFPVTPEFAANPGSRRPPSQSDGRRVLYMINFAKRQAPDLVAALLKIEGIELTVTVGRDEELRARIEAVVRPTGKAVEIFGWTPRLPELVMRSHLLIS
jgi:UDP-N-acetylglucosamine:LPS N-acetylglucosamine transferase